MRFPHPRKRFGQHFLIDHNIVNKILIRAEVHPHEHVLEIGPGRGALTKRLCQVASRVLAIEIDVELFAYLQTELQGFENVEVVLGDALDFSYTNLSHNMVVVANLPYNISTPLLFKLFEARALIDRMILMVQLEVARRIVANAGTREYGVLSVLSQYFADVELAFKVPRTCFSPRPDVESAIIELRPKSSEQIGIEQECEAFVRVVKAAFSHRRKTLFNAMRDAGFHAHVLQSGFEMATIDGRCRAETLNVKDFQRLTQALHPSS
ncbi:MAG: 16S rRNA (adenine(1518)-N(6)/adenine(1519)-N(6))-dimethyltransferase RsmA [Nitrospirales bacterium]|nr:ribosomal RNA small subunit methyltransferase A [Nitrospira sp.]MDR4501249.1 16S rRNA (adenine(1518)-N(6)/adenine(1519)-N(6))-dimethyltransferase RsmA [Nitrospirales bacterium]